jgi:hypothetical protein
VEALEDRWVPASIVYQAADPTLYTHIVQGTSAFTNLTPPTGTLTAAQNTTLQNAGLNPIFSQSVSSLAPAQMSLGQIVPFFFDVTSTSTGTIQITADWNAKTTSGGAFGYDEAFKVYTAFVNPFDPTSSSGLNASVSFTSSILGAGTSNERIDGVFTLTGLKSGQSAVVEVWLVLDKTIPSGVSGNVQSKLVSAILNPGTSKASAIMTGSQTVPLLKVQQFLLGSPTLATTPGPTVVVGSGTALTDSATLSGGKSPTGTLTFTLYAPDGKTVVYTDVVTVNGAGTYTTSQGNTPGGYIPNATGIYQWVVSYSGDTSNNGTVGTLGSEPETVSKASPSIATTSGPDITLSNATPSKLTDSATLSKGFNPTGTLTFQLYAPDGKTVVYTDVVTVNGNGTYTTSQGSTPGGYTLPSTGTVTGTYQWVVTYNGDGNNNTSTSPLGSEPENVNWASPSVATQAGPTLTLGSGAALSDSATLSGGYRETGTITFTLTAPDGKTVLYTDVVTVSGNGTYTTSQGSTPGGYIPTAAGTYFWSATYSGDGNNNPAKDNGVNESEVVQVSSVKLATYPGADITLSAKSGNLTDSATLSGGSSPTGTLTFQLYAPDGKTVVYTDVVTVKGNGTYDTSGGSSPGGFALPSTGTVTGTYQWVVTYSGDGNNGSAYSPFGSEPESVKPASPNISTTVNPGSGTIGVTVLNDSATLSGGYYETGNITFTLYAPDGTIAYTETVGVKGDGTYSTNNTKVVVTQTGTYFWIASYSGDGNNLKTASGAKDEPVYVNQITPKIDTVVNPGSGVVGVIIPNDTATLAGGFNETGTITFTLYAPDGKTVVYTETVGVKGDGSYSTSNSTVVATQAGTYFWVASYSGDNQNSPVSSGFKDEPVNVNKASPAISTTPGPDITLSNVTPANLTDSATLSGGFNETGTVTFQLYAPDGTTVVYTDVVTVNGNGTYTTSQGNNPGGFMLPASGTVTGTYQWVVTYSGDGNNYGVASAFGSEPQKVNKASPNIVTTAGPDITLSSATPPPLTDSATLSGGFRETGTLTFKLFGPDGTTVVYTNVVTVNGDGTYTTSMGNNPGGFVLPITGSVTGTYQWVVTFSGDGNNYGVSSAFGSEPQKVNKASPTVFTTPSPTSTVQGNKLNDSATLSGGFRQTGTLTFRLFDPNGTLVYIDVVTVNGNGTYTTSMGNNPGGLSTDTNSLTGTYQWVVTYSGDANNNTAASLLGQEPAVLSPANFSKNNFIL